MRHLSTSTLLCVYTSAHDKLLTWIFFFSIWPSLTFSVPRLCLLIVMSGDFSGSGLHHLAALKWPIKTPNRSLIQIPCFLNLFTHHPQPTSASLCVIPHVLFSCPYFSLSSCLYSGSDCIFCFVSIYSLLIFPCAWSEIFVKIFNSKKSHRLPGAIFLAHGNRDFVIKTASRVRVSGRKLAYMNFTSSVKWYSANWRKLNYLGMWEWWGCSVAK